MQRGDINIFVAGLCFSGAVTMAVDGNAWLTLMSAVLFGANLMMVWILRRD